MQDCKGVPTPMTPTTTLTVASTSTSTDGTLFRCVVGKLKQVISIHA